MVIKEELSEEVAGRSIEAETSQRPSIPDREKKRLEIHVRIISFNNNFRKFFVCFTRLVGMAFQISGRQ